VLAAGVKFNPSEGYQSWSTPNGRPHPPRRARLRADARGRDGAVREVMAVREPRAM